MRRKGAGVQSGTDIQDILPSFERHQAALNRSPKTIRAYQQTLGKLRGWLADHERATTIEAVEKADVEAFFADVRDHVTPNSLATYHWHLKAFFRWLLDEGEIARNPMVSMRSPFVPEEPPELLKVEDVRRLLKTCEGNEFLQRRDMAILRLLVDTGLRRSGIASILLEDVDLAHSELRVRLKGGRHLLVTYGHKAAVALDRYLRVRGRQKHADLPDLWITQRGRLTSDGLYQMVRHRAESVGLVAWVHLFRHGWAHGWMAAGGSETGLMRMAGWRSRNMLSRYGASAADERARDEARQLHIGDSI